jgi:hypothetical protein
MQQDANSDELRVDDGGEVDRSDYQLDGDDDEADVEGIDWAVFIIRASAVIALGAMLITSVDLSFNQGADWKTVMRFSILPFTGGVLLLAAAELIERIGD